MAINGQALFEAKVQQFGAQGSDTRFPVDYLNALGNALNEFATATDAAPITIPADVAASIELDQQYLSILMAGLDCWILRFGNFKSGDLDITKADALWQRALGQARTIRDRATREAATDDEVIGLLDTDSDT